MKLAAIVAVLKKTGLLEWAPLKRFADKTVDAPLPSPLRAIAELAVNLLSWEVLFYTSHRILHTPRFYKMIHKKHHTYKAPITLASNYANDIEHICGNVLPGLVAPLIMTKFCNSHLASHWLWLAFGSFLTNMTHSGYIFPFSPMIHPTLNHDYHHHSFYSQLGTLGIMDKLMGTDGGNDFKEWKAEVVNRIFAGMPLHASFASLF